MQHVLLKSKIHRACVTVADVDYEGSIEIPSDLMEAAGIWEGERVLEPLPQRVVGLRPMLRQESRERGKSL